MVLSLKVYCFRDFIYRLMHPSTYLLYPVLFRSEQLKEVEEKVSLEKAEVKEEKAEVLHERIQLKLEREDLHEEEIKEHALKVCNKVIRCPSILIYL